eukprot:TRINITY_DN57644_c0_g1_i1.p1 TRINITY_DN57644_c0_g1~~TRINITY_DN57644_c0_g1_i1.p1  ORF type:complete len:124 (-),score=19.52 TRINITY_DN57644_c0_g1_i1:121-492(-)
MLRSLVGSEMCIRDSIGGGYSGPLRGVLGAAAIKVATLGRLSSSVTVLIALLQQLVPLLNSQKNVDDTTTASSTINAPRLAEDSYSWNHVFEPTVSLPRNKGRYPTLKPVSYTHLTLPTKRIV